MTSLIKNLLKKFESYIFYLRTGYLPVESTTKVESKQPTELEYTLDIIKTLNISDPSYIYTPSLSHVKVPVYADNVFKQITFTKTLISCLKSDTLISKSALDGVVKTIYLRDFFVDDDGNYDDVVMRSQELAEVSRTLLELFIQKEDTEQSDSSSFHNRLVLGIITQVIMNYYRCVSKTPSFRAGI